MSPTTNRLKIEQYGLTTLAGGKIQNHQTGKISQSSGHAAGRFTVWQPW